MRRLLLTLAFLPLALPASTRAAPAPPAPPTATASPAAPAPHPATGAFPFPLTVNRLENGLTYVFVPFDSPGLTAFYTVVRTGSRNEVEKGRSGFAHFFEHMMFRGTERHPAAAYDEALARAGIAHNAFTTDDFTAYHCFGPTAQLPLVTELEADRFRNLKYSEDDFRTESQAVLGEYHKNLANPLEKMEESLRDAAFSQHPYRHTTMGFEADIVAMPGMYAYSLEFFRRWYTPDNVFLVLVGDFDAPRAEALIRERYGTWQGTVASSLVIPPEPAQKAQKEVRLTWPSPTQPRALYGWHTPEARTDTSAAAVQAVLGPYLFGPTSPAFRELVLEQQVVSSLGLGYSDHRDPYLFVLLVTSLEPAGLATARATVEKSLAELKAGRVDEKRLAAVKSNQKYGLLNSFDDAEQVALQLTFAIGATGEPRALDAFLSRVEALGAQDMVTFARQWFDDKNLTTVTLTNAGGER